MPSYNYKALDGSGREVVGQVTAEGRAGALEAIGARGLQALVLTETGEAAGAAPKAAATGRGVGQGAVQAFTRQLSNLLSAGVPLSRGLRLLSQEASQPAARAQWAAIHDDVAEGTSLGDALARWPRSFPPVYVAMVRAGETGGFLDLVLEQIAEFRDRERDLKGKVKAALVYPCVLAVLASVVLAFLLTYFIPRFSAMFAEFGGRLPWLTRGIVSVSHFVTGHALAIGLGILLTVVAVRRALTGEAGRRAFERAVLRVPALGTVVAQFALVRFCRMLGTLLAAGVPLVSALRVAREAIGNQSLADTVLRAVEEVQRGATLASSLGSSSRLFPPAVVEMVSVAEESGRLDRELLRVAGSYEGELSRRLQMLVALAEPALLFLMAGIVGTVVIGMLLPVFTLQDLIR
jgi:type II secretory pathway component PulF